MKVVLMRRAQQHTHRSSQKKAHNGTQRQTQASFTWARETMTNWEFGQRKGGIYIVKWTGARWNKWKDYLVAFSVLLPPFLFIAFSVRRFKRDPSYSLPSGQRSFQVFGGGVWIWMVHFGSWLKGANWGYFKCFRREQNKSTENVLKMHLKHPKIQWNDLTHLSKGFSTDDEKTMSRNCVAARRRYNGTACLWLELGIEWTHYYYYQPTNDASSNWLVGIVLAAEIPFSLSGHHLCSDPKQAETF